MRFGIVLPVGGSGVMYPEQLVSPPTILQVAKEAEALGFDAIHVNDHPTTPLLARTYGGPMVMFEAITTLSYLAGLTSGIRLVTSTILLPFRNPVVLAREVSTLDNLSGGRVTLGIGLGDFEDEYSRLNVPYDARGTIQEEYLGAMRELWTKGSASFAGKYVRFKDVDLRPKPVQDPLPVWIAGRTGRSIKRAAKLGDGWLTYSGASKIEEEVQRFTKSLREAGRGGDEVEIVVQDPISIAGEREEAERLWRNFPMVKDLYRGREDEIRERSMVGAPSDVIKAIETYFEHGVDHLSMIVVSFSLDEMVRAMNLFAREVAPSF